MYRHISLFGLKIAEYVYSCLRRFNGGFANLFNGESTTWGCGSAKASNGCDGYQLREIDKLSILKSVRVTVDTSTIYIHTYICLDERKLVSIEIQFSQK